MRSLSGKGLSVAEVAQPASAMHATTLDRTDRNRWQGPTGAERVAVVRLPVTENAKGAYRESPKATSKLGTAGSLDMRVTIIYIMRTAFPERPSTRKADLSTGVYPQAELSVAGNLGDQGHQDSDALYERGVA